MVFGSENVLIVVERPAEIPAFGERIAGLCRAGRPPFVVVLTDGPNPAAGEAAVQAGLAAAGLSGGRLLMFGIAGAVPLSGPVLAAAVRALCFISWRHDCTMVVAPGGAAGIARAAVAETGLRLTGSCL